MKVTTSRKPSPGTRRFAKTLATFLGLPYVTRGKSNLDPDEVWFVVVERHGSPSGIEKRTGGAEETLSFTISAAKRIQKLKTRRPWVVGTFGMSRSVAGFFSLEWDPEDRAERTIRVTGELMEFKDGEDTILRLKIYEGPC